MFSFRTSLCLLALLFVLASPNVLAGQNPAAGQSRRAATDARLPEEPTSLSWHLLLGLGVVLVVGGGFLRRRTSVFAGQETDHRAKVMPLETKRKSTRDTPAGPATRIG